jgi:hypothetical protein
MPKQPPLFDDLEPAPATAAGPANTAPIRLQAGGRKLSPEQQRFNRQLAELERLQLQTQELQSLTDAFRPQFSAGLEPLRQRFAQCERAMVLLLHQRLQRPGLTKVQQSTARRILTSISEQHALQGDAQMKELHDLHCEEGGLDAQQQQDLEETREILQDEMGVDLSGIDANSAAELLAQALQRQFERHQAQAQARADKRAAKQSAKKAAAQAALPPEAQRTPEHADPKSLLRSLYRQLASDLHPDREPDERLRAEKTQLMSQANTAYQSGDLAALLHLQWRTQQISPEAMAQWSQQRLNALSSLLKDQIKTAKEKLEGVRHRLQGELMVPPIVPLTSRGLQHHLAQEKLNWQNTLHTMERDLRDIEDDKTLKQWLKDQRRLIKERDQFYDQLDDMGLHY